MVELQHYHTFGEVCVLAQNVESQKKARGKEKSNQPVRLPMRYAINKGSYPTPKAQTESISGLPISKHIPLEEEEALSAKEWDTLLRIVLIEE